ncbi:MAG: hypothetical protein KKF80_08150, partial [Candidatus Omnitrophica bacterium]|nr:hypothetical protein [Candidatus Omnitrophota bacterium]
MKKQNNQQFEKKNINKKILFISIAILIIGLLFNKFRHSLFITRPDRLNLVFYGQNTTFYSLDLENRIHYRINFSPDIRLIVPGGYDEYRVGSLGKLIKLENEPKLLRQTFSAALSNFVHLYFYPDNNLIYQQENNYSKSLPSIKQLIANKSNAGWLDRLYLFILFFIQGREINQNIASLVVTDKDNDRVWQREDFMKKYLGYWYSKDLRQERAAAQVIYHENYRTALLLSNTIEGNGVKVVDLSENTQNTTNNI